MDTNISIGLGNGRMIFLLGGKEPGTKNQEQRRVSASLKLAVFILITDNRQLKTNISNQLTTNQLITILNFSIFANNASYSKNRHTQFIT